MEKQLIAYCGIDCSACPAYQITRAGGDLVARRKLAQEWSGVQCQFDAEEIACNGCMHSSWKMTERCNIRKCALKERSWIMKYRNGGFLISKIHQLSGRIFARKLKECGVEDLNPAQGRILFVLWQKDGITIHDLSKKTSLEKSTLTSMLDRLEQSGHLYRKPCADDRRKTLIYLSSKHQTYRETFDHVSEEMTRLYYEGMSSEEIDAFESYLERILANLERHTHLTGSINRDNSRDDQHATQRGNQ